MKTDEPLTYLKDILIHYEGELTVQSLDVILNTAEQILISSEESLKVRKKIFNVLVEALQNAFNYLKIGDVKDQRLRAATFSLIREESAYEILIGNYILSEKIEKLRNQIEKVNRATPEELKEYYLATLQAQEMSPQGGAGLGIIDIVRKSGQKIRYRFRNINHQYSHFALQTSIPIN